MAEEHNSGDGTVRRELGISRRDLIRRGAVVGGTLLWAAPVIKTLSGTALAHEVKKGTPNFFCCWCKFKKKPKGGPKGQCVSATTKAQCDSICRGSPYNATKGEFHSSPNPIPCDNNKKCGKHKTK